MYQYLYLEMNYSEVLAENDRKLGSCRVYIPKATNIKSRVGSENANFLDFLSKCLKIDPSARMSAK